MFSWNALNLLMRFVSHQRKIKETQGAGTAVLGVRSWSSRPLWGPAGGPNALISAWLLGAVLGYLLFPLVASFWAAERRRPHFLCSGVVSLLFFFSSLLFQYFLISAEDVSGGLLPGCRHRAVRRVFPRNFSRQRLGWGGARWTQHGVFIDVM